jgi:hypothetical protein
MKARLCVPWLLPKPFRLGFLGLSVTGDLWATVAIVYVGVRWWCEGWLPSAASSAPGLEQGIIESVELAIEGGGCGVVVLLFALGCVSTGC